MKWPRVLAPFAAALALVALLAAATPWATVTGPAIVQVTALAPMDVEPGDRIAIAGEGFPAGKEARVTFRGTLHRPGEAPLRDAEVVATGVVTGPEEVAVDFRESTQALFCGAGDRAAHTTFEGDVEVAFAAAWPGAAPIAGVLRNAVLDVRPSVSATDRDRELEGRRAMDFVGLHVANSTRRGLGLIVNSVDPGSRAEAAGLVPGDVVTTFDGVRAASLSDLVPVAGERAAMLGVQSAGATVDAQRSLAVDGLRAAPPAEFVGAAVIIVGALSILVLFATSAPARIGAALQGAVARLRASGSPSAERWQPGGRRQPADARMARATIAGALRDALPPASPSTAVDAGVAALFGVLPFGQYLVAARLDVAILFVAAVTSAAIAASAGARSAWDGLRSSLHMAWQHVPAGLGLVSIVLATGSLRVQEIDRAQGGWPWDWLAFRSPAGLVALLLLLGCGACRVEPAPGRPPVSGLQALTAEDDAPTRVSRGAWFDAASRAHRFIVAGLASSLFLGGWSLPGLSAAQQDGRLTLELVGAGLLLGKTWALVILLAAARLARPTRHLLENSRATGRRGLPLALAALAATVGWTSWTAERAAQSLVSGSLVTVAVLAAIAVVQGLRYGATSSAGDGHLSPFL